LLYIKGGLNCPLFLGRYTAPVLYDGFDKEAGTNPGLFNCYKIRIKKVGGIGIEYFLFYDTFWGLCLWLLDVRVS